MSEHEYMMLECLRWCELGIGSSFKGFVKITFDRGKNHKLTDKQSTWLRNKFFSYRNQIGEGVVLDAIVDDAVKTQRGAEWWLENEERVSRKMSKFIKKQRQENLFKKGDKGGV